MKIILLFIIVIAFISKIIHITNIPIDSVCSSFIGSVEYDSDKELCILPCRIKNKYKIIIKPDNEDCPMFKSPISIEKNRITALVDTELSQYFRKFIIFKLYI